MTEVLVLNGTISLKVTEGNSRTYGTRFWRTWCSGKDDGLARQARSITSQSRLSASSTIRTVVLPASNFSTSRLLRDSRIRALDW